MREREFSLQNLPLEILLLTKKKTKKTKKKKTEI